MSLPLANDICCISIFARVKKERKKAEYIVNWSAYTWLMVFRESFFVGGQMVVKEECTFWKMQYNFKHYIVKSIAKLWIPGFKSNEDSLLEEMKLSYGLN